jgi:hypothetical protein
MCCTTQVDECTMDWLFCFKNKKQTRSTPAHAGWSKQRKTSGRAIVTERGGYAQRADREWKPQRMGGGGRVKHTVQMCCVCDDIRAASHPAGQSV